MSTRIIHGGKLLIRACERMEIPLILFGDGEDRFDHFNSCSSPANSGFINCGNAVTMRPIEIHWSKYELCNQLHLCGLAHEMAHFAFNVNPENADEVDGPMLAFEAALHDYAEIGRRAVDAWMSNFRLEESDWLHASWSDRVDALFHSRAFAVRMKLLTPDGQLTWKSLKPKEKRPCSSTHPLKTASTAKPSERCASTAPSTGASSTSTRSSFSCVVSFDEPHT